MVASKRELFKASNPTIPNPQDALDEYGYDAKRQEILLETSDQGRA